MNEIQAVKDPVPDPKAGKQRPKSGVAFPYYNLAQSIEVAKVMYEQAGGVCDRSQLAAMLKYKGTNNGGFLSRVSAAKMFGLIEPTSDGLSVSARGRAIVAPVTAVAADQSRIDAFLAIDLFKRVFDRFNGQPLPPEVGLRNLLLSEYQVVQDRVAPTVRIMLESAELAGFFKTAGNSRMVLPVGTASVNMPRQSAPDHPPAQPENGKHGGGGGRDGSNIHPAILGLLNELPPAGTTMSSKKRANLIAAFTAAVGWIYPESEEAQG